MRNRFRPFLLVSSIAVFAVVAFLCIRAIGWYLVANELWDDGSKLPSINDAVVLTKTMAYTTRPLKRNESKQLLEIDFPPDATDIQFAKYSQFIAYEIAVSFRAPPDTCLSYAKDLITAFNKENPKDHIPTDLTPIHELPPQKPVTRELNAPWFRSETIRNGFKSENPSARIYIDMERGIFFFEQND